MKHLLIGTLLLAAFASESYAAPGRKIQFRTLCLEQIQGLEKVVLPSGKDLAKNQEVVLYTDLSPVMEGVFTNDEAVFYTEKSGDDGKLVRTAVGKAILGKSDRQLFLFHPGGEGEGKLPYDVQAYDDDLKSFALGSVRAINLAPLPVRIVMPEATGPPIAAGQFAKFTHSKKVDDYNMYPVSVEFQIEGGEWLKAQAVSWKASDRRREIVVMLEDVKTKQHTVKMFSDVPPWVADPSTPRRK